MFTPMIETSAGRFSGGIVFKDGVDSGNPDQYDEAATIKMLSESGRAKVKITSAKLVDFDAEIKAEEAKLAAAEKAQAERDASEEGNFEAAFDKWISERKADELAKRKAEFKVEYDKTNK